MNTKLLIDGKLVTGKGTAEQVLDPASGKVLATVNEASKAQIEAAVHAAQAAYRRLGGNGTEGPCRVVTEACRPHRD